MNSNWRCVSALLMSAILTSAGSFAADGEIERAKKFFKQLEGSWDAKITFNQSPQKLQGVETNKLTPAGNWLITDFSGGEWYSGHGFYGYELDKKQYTSAWIDSFKPGLRLTRGELDDTEKVMTFKDEKASDDGVKIVLKIIDVDNRQFSVITKQPGGEEIVQMQIEYSRRK